MSSSYQLGRAGTVIETLEGGAVTSFAYRDDMPDDGLNQRAALYRAWLAAGNTPTPADPPPLVYSGFSGIDARLQTTDATQTELYRATLRQNTAYMAILTLSGVDLGNRAVRIIRASIVAKRLANGAALVGAPVVIANHQDTGTAAWAIGASVAGNDFVVTVTGAAGRTIAWRLSGSVESFTPGGS